MLKRCSKCGLFIDLDETKIIVQFDELLQTEISYIICPKCSKKIIIK